MRYKGVKRFKQIEPAWLYKITRWIRCHIFRYHIIDEDVSEEEFRCCCGKLRAKL